MITNLGFTGTREAKFISQKRRDNLDNFLSHFIRGKGLSYASEGSPSLTLSHGDCVGADEMAHNIGLGLGYSIEIYPPSNDTLRAYCEGAFIVHPEKSYMPRNEDIVDASELLIAMPATFIEQSKGGTWRTVRYARRKLIPVLFI